MKIDRSSRYILLLILATLAVNFFVLKGGFISGLDESNVSRNTSLTLPLPAYIESKLGSALSERSSLIVEVSFWAEYHCFERNSLASHATNLFLHLISTMMVFYLVRFWSKGDGIAFVVALFFGIHPLQVEPVAWISQRGFLFAGAFLFASLLSFLKWRENKRNIFYILSLFFYLLSLLSSFFGIFLPMLLFLFPLSEKIVAKKKYFLSLLPFILMSLLFCYPLVRPCFDAWKNDFSWYNISFALLHYLFQAIVPYHLSNVYPFIPFNKGIPPIKDVVAVTVLSAMLIVGLKYFDWLTPRLSGMVFFLTAILPALFLSRIDGEAAGDRYMYIPLAGILYFVVQIFSDGLYSYQIPERIKPAVVFILFSIFSAITVSRIPVWTNGVTLWTNTIQQYLTLPLAYRERSRAYLSDAKFNLALSDADKALDLDAESPEGYFTRGLVYAVIDPTNAVSDFSKVIGADPLRYEAYFQRGMAENGIRRPAEALSDFSFLIARNENRALALANRGISYMQLGRYPEAISDYNAAVVADPALVNAYTNIAITYFLAHDTLNARAELVVAKKKGASVSDQISDIITGKGIH